MNLEGREEDEDEEVKDEDRLAYQIIFCNMPATQYTKWATTLCHIRVLLIKQMTGTNFDNEVKCGDFKNIF